MSVNYEDLAGYNPEKGIRMPTIQRFEDMIAAGKNISQIQQGLRNELIIHIQTVIFFAHFGLKKENSKEADALKYLIRVTEGSSDDLSSDDAIVQSHILDNTETLTQNEEYRDVIDALQRIGTRESMPEGNDAVYHIAEMIGSLRKILAERPYGQVLFRAIDSSATAVSPEFNKAVEEASDDPEAIQFFAAIESIMNLNNKKIPLNIRFTHSLIEHVKRQGVPLPTTK